MCTTLYSNVRGGPQDIPGPEVDTVSDSEDSVDWSTGWIDVSGNDGVSKKILEAGRGDVIPSGANIRAHYSVLPKFEDDLHMGRVCCGSTHCSTYCRKHLIRIKCASACLQNSAARSMRWALILSI